VHKGVERRGTNLGQSGSRFSLDQLSPEQNRLLDEIAGCAADRSAAWRRSGPMSVIGFYTTAAMMINAFDAPVRMALPQP
jgi:hypothetical protein